MEECKTPLDILTGKPTRKKPLERPRCGWEDNNKTDFKYIGINNRNWVHWVKDRNYWRDLVNVAFHLQAS